MFLHRKSLNKYTFMYLWITLSYNFYCSAHWRQKLVLTVFTKIVLRQGINAPQGSPLFEIVFSKLKPTCFHNKMWPRTDVTRHWKWHSCNHKLITGAWSLWTIAHNKCQIYEKIYEWKMVYWSLIGNKQITPSKMTMSCMWSLWEYNESTWTFFPQR